MPPGAETQRQVKSARIVALLVWQAPVESFTNEIEKHDVAFWVVSPAGRGMVTQIGAEHAPGSTVTTPPAGENDTGPATVQPGPAGSAFADQW
jgi:hypothetical protein